MRMPDGSALITGLRHRVEQRVRGPDVERDHVVRRAAGWQPRHVRDAAEVEHDAALARARERGAVEERRERRALAARGEIARAEVRDHGAARALGDHGGVADLERGAAFGMMRHRLPVRRDQRDAFERHAGASGDRARGRREALAQLDVEPRQLREHVAPGQPSGGEPVDARLERRLERRLVEGEQPEGLRLGPVGPLHERRVHAVRGGS
jgi:hypothetical protein